MNQPIPKYILLPSTQYLQMKSLIHDLNTCITKFATTMDRTLIHTISQKYQNYTHSLQKLCKQISQQFQDGKINKITLQTQIQSLQTNLREVRQTVYTKQKQISKYSSELMKISQENDKLKQYIRKIKQENKNYKVQMQQLVQTLSAKVKRYKHQFQQKQNAYIAKIKYLQGKLENTNNVGEDLDKQLEELAKLEAEVDYRDQ